MRRPSKLGSRASKSGCSVTTSQQQTASAIGAGPWWVKRVTGIIEKLPQAATWAEVKAELCLVLGDGEPKKRAFEILSRYKPKSKGLAGNGQ